VTRQPTRTDEITKGHKVPKSAILAGAALALPFAANADIIYNPTDLSVTSTAGDQTLNLDLDGNSVVDFIFTANFNTGTDTVTPQGSNGYIGTSGDVPTPLSMGTIIGGPSTNFQTGSGILQQSISGAQVGPWPVATLPFKPNPSAYLGVEFYIGSDLHYGWVNVNTCTPELGGACGGVTSSYSNITIDGWAYETTPNTPIAAGAGTVPEPSFLPLLALGAAGLAAFRARRKQAA
jgi:PEP-CTERM motif